MNYIGLDLGQTASQICCLTTDGEMIERRIKTERETLAQFFAKMPGSRILLEASTISEWVARYLEELGHKVIIADPNFAPMYATRSKRIKTDKRDARALCEAAQLGAYREIHRVSDHQKRRRQQITVRETLVRTRSRYITVIRSLLRAEGWQIMSHYAETFAGKVKDLALSAELQETVEPLRLMIEQLSAQIQVADRKLEEIVDQDEEVQRLTSVPGVGKVTAVVFVATLDEVKRFESAKNVRSYLGLVPSEHSSGEKQKRGSISKVGNSRLRSLLVEVGWAIMRRTSCVETRALREWANRIVERRGKRIAVVALARKLAGILYAMWRDGTPFKVPDVGLG
jgi:transposase